MVTKAMTAFTHDAATQVLACQAICRFVTACEKRPLCRFLKLSYLQASTQALTAVRDNMQHAPVIICAVRALVQLAHKNSGHVHKMVALGSIEVLSVAMITHPGNSELLLISGILLLDYNKFEWFTIMQRVNLGHIVSDVLKAQCVGTHHETSRFGWKSEIMLKTFIDLLFMIIEDTPEYRYKTPRGAPGKRRRARARRRYKEELDSFRIMCQLLIGSFLCACECFKHYAVVTRARQTLMEIF
jgi:hypothetical protein